MQDAGLIHERRSATKPLFSEQEQNLKCPRCDSTNTKFCYYNNYNMSQPRHFCKNCRRYWTKGGTLRNIPVGGGSRKNSKKPLSSSPKAKSAPNSASSPPSSSWSSLLKPETDLSGIYGLAPAAADYDRRLLDITGTFSSLLASNGQLGALCDPVRMQGTLKSAVPTAWSLPEYSEPRTVALNPEGLELIAGNNGDGILGESGGWEGGNWPDLAVYTPESNFR